MSAKLIGIIGPPAAGKTTLAELLAEELPAGVIREDYAGNPFLADSWAGQDDKLLAGQFYFLMSRVKQLALSAWPDDGTFVSDYGFCQDRIFAESRLSADDLALYDRVAGCVAGLVHRPDLLIHLDADAGTLLERIGARGQGFEKAMDERFLSRMREAYDCIEARATCPVIRIDCDAADLRDAGQCGELIAKIRGHVESI